MTKKILKQALELGKIEALKSPVNNKYCAVLIFRNNIVSCAYNTFKGTVHGNLKQCLLC